jgi:UDP-N-acetylmuramyl pentapeptide phosphotransferase/UDP-N-acetylglucosamine-1-phosphate transferase
MSEIAWGLVAALLAYALVGVTRRFVVARRVLDHPNERSSHVVPTPRGAGIGLLAAITVTLVASIPHTLLTWPYVAGFLAFIPAAIVGWLDDRGSLAIGPRIAAHVASGLLLVPLALSADNTVTLRLALGLWWVIAAVSAINVVNFMDGIDGIIGLQTLVFGAHLAALRYAVHQSPLIGVVVAGGALGFLAWNWPPAKIFLGDVGSCGAAVLTLFAALVVLRETPWIALAVFVPLFPLFLDVSVTLLRRMARGERVFQAHRTHLYQRLANGGWGHAAVSAMFGFATAIGSVVVLVSHGNIASIGGYCASVLLVFLLLDRRYPSTVKAVSATELPSV